MEKTEKFFLTTMIGAHGRAVSTLNPEGTVTIRGELWQATAAGDSIKSGEMITVIGQEEFTLTVDRRNNTAAKETH